MRPLRRGGRGRRRGWWAAQRGSRGAGAGEGGGDGDDGLTGIAETRGRFELAARGEFARVDAADALPDDERVAAVVDGGGRDPAARVAGNLDRVAGTRDQVQRLVAACARREARAVARGDVAVVVGGERLRERVAIRRAERVRLGELLPGRAEEQFDAVVRGLEVGAERGYAGPRVGRDVAGEGHVGGRERGQRTEGATVEDAADVVRADRGRGAAGVGGEQGEPVAVDGERRRAGARAGDGRRCRPGAGRIGEQVDPK